jgi:hypothetical protein
MEQAVETCKHFLSYSGVRLPLKLVNPLEPGEIENRNTFYRGYFDSEERLLRLEKVVYGEVEVEHRYCYYDHGILKQAEITMDDETNVINYDEQGQPA